MKYFFILGLISALSIKFLSAQTQQEADLYYSQATELYQQKQYLKAADLFEKSAIIEEQLKPINIESLVLELQNAGMCYAHANNKLKAIRILTRVYDIYEENKQIENQAVTLYSIIEIYEDLNIEEKSEEILYIEKVINLCIESHKYTELVLSYNKLAAIYKDLEQFDRAIENTRNAVNFCKKIDKTQLIAFTNNSHGEILLFFNENDSAVSFFDTAYSEYKKLNLENDIAVVCNNLGIAYSAIYKYDEALKYNNEAEELFTKLNDKNGLANTINNTGKIYENWGKYELAISNYHKSIKLFEQIKDYKGMAIVYNNMGSYYFLTSFYDVAIENFNQSENIFSQLNDQYGIAGVKNNKGRLYHNLGDYDKAISEYIKAEKIYKNENDIGAIAIVYNNIGGVYNAWAQYDTALIYYTKAYTIQTKLQRKSEIAKALNNIADVYVAWGQYDKALNKYDEALTLFTETNNKRDIASVYSNIGSVNFSWGNYSKANEYYNKSLLEYSKLNDLSNKATVINNIGSIYFTLKDYKLAKTNFELALGIRREINEKKNISESLYHLGVVYMNMGDLLKSTTLLEESILILEQLRNTAKGNVRRDFLASQIQVYESIVLCNIKNNDIPKAFYYNELSSAKSFAELLSKKDTNAIVSVNTAQEQLSPNSCALVYATIDNPTLTSFAVTKNGPVGAILTNKSNMINVFLSDLEIRGKLIQNLNKSEILEVKQFIQSNGEYHLKISMQKKLFDSFVMSYVELLGEAAFGNKDKVEKLSKALYNLLITPVESYIKEHKKILIVPNGVLSRLPFETLINSDGKYLIDEYDISYVNSMTIKNLLSKRNYANFTKDILAIGLSNFQNGDKIDLSKYVFNKDQASSISKIAGRLAQEHSSLTPIYMELGYNKLNNLPGSISEIIGIKQIYTHSDTLTNIRASEGRVKYLSNNGDLKKYKIIHFSTHGISVPEIPLLSSLVLHLNAEDVNGEDGYLRVGEISELQLNTELVNLSACETGAGKVYSGEGVVGLTQAFIGAGANSVVLSQWEVDEEASAYFMKEFYNIIKHENITYSDAINKVKRKFISGEANIFWKDPLFWAPFTYYGKE